MKKFFFALTLTLLLTINLPLVSVLAEETTVSTSSAETTITNNLKKRIQDTIKTVKENVVTAKPQPLAYIGKVEDIIQHTIKINTPKDNIKYAHLDDQTVIIRSPANRQIKLTDIRLDDGIIAIGYPQTNEPDTILAKRVIVSQNLSFKLNKLSGMAKIKTKTSRYLELEPLGQNSNQIDRLNLTASTVVKNKDQVLQLQDLKAEQTIIYTAITSNQRTTATIIMIISD